MSVHGEWATHKRRTYVPTRQTAQFMRFGTPGHPVDELVIYGSQLKGVMGTGTIRKLTLVDKADTHAQDGAGWNASVSLKDLGQTGWDAVSSVGFGVKGGDSSKVVDGKAEFKCDGVEVLAIERITAETYDRRYGVNLTKHFTSTGDAAGAAAAYAPGYSGRLELGEDSVGFELPNVMFHEKTETTSQQITRRDAEQAALEAQRQREAAQRAADAAEELQRNALKAICDQFERENPTLVKDLIAKEAAEAEAKRAAEAQRQRDLAAQRAAAAAKDTELQKEKINEALVNMLTPGQLAQNVADAEYKKTSAYQIEQELQHIKARTQEMQKMSAAEKNTPEWRKEFMDLHQASERLGVFDPEWRERQATAGAAGMVGTLAVLAPQFTYRMMLGHLAGKAMTEGLLQNAHSEEDVAMAHLVGLTTDLTMGSHMPTGGLFARGVPLTTAAAATAESGGLLNRLRAAGQEFGQWRPDPHAMGSGFLPFTRKAPPAIGTPLEIATAGEARAAASVAPVAEAASSAAPVAEAAVKVQTRYEIINHVLEDQVRAGTEGFVCRICPLKGGPLSIDCSAFKVTPSTPLTKLGVPRDSVQFWKHFREKYDTVFPEIWSETNLGRFRDGISPKVDSEWLKYFPEHGKYLNEILEHHHINHGNIAIPLPDTMHKGKLFNRMNHHPETYIKEVTE
ncbi:hypothetical protein [Candidatus Bodocaedibacter vickermanii]|uniref:Toxin with Tox-HNH-HHH nuclease domain n=1 Tax=Candidatus Bodocaedibacter vickermanii TaxID=2741701 RepID=A0A7L9RSE0_9PROT|nr:Toxin with Tox-HNH-HHH nuclease domain [Candidatus Paracaedibacteraceae bacterium 'Lake Konstanz']